MKKTLPKRGTWFPMHLLLFQVVFLCSGPLIVNAQDCLYDTEDPTINCTQNQLANSSFETNNGNDQPPIFNWSQFGSVFIQDQNVVGTAQNGDFFVKMFGGNSGLFQDFPVNPGDNIAASVYMQNASFDPTGPGAGGQIKLEWQGVPGVETSPFFTNAAPLNVWTEISVSAVAPPGATGVRFVLICNLNSGAIMYDNASLINSGAGVGGGGLVGDVTVGNDPVLCGANLVLATPAADDNCSVVSITNDFNGTDDASGFYPVGTTTVTWTVTDDGMGTLPDIALLSATGGVPNAQEDIVAKLTATGAFNSISTINVRQIDGITPTLATLQQYDAVLVWNDDPFQNEFALGNVLAAYVDAGGGVVVSMFTQWSPSDFDLQGAFRTNGYLPLDGTASPFAAAGPHTMNIVDGLHPIMNGVGSFNGGSSSFRGTNLSLQTGASLLANWSTGDPLIAYKEPTNGRTVSLNFYPPSSDINGSYWNSSTDGDVIMANALLWAAGHVNTGNTATCTVEITVNDTEAPTITCVEEITANTDESSCGAQLTLAVPDSGDNCSDVSITNDFNGTGDASGFYPLGTTTVVWTIALPDIALLSATGGVPNAEEDIVAKLTATGAFNSISTIDVAVATPTLATLEQYDAVLVWSDDPFLNEFALGDVLAAYVDAGGGVVVGMFTQWSPSVYDLQGAFRNNGYLPLDGSTSLNPTDDGPIGMSIIDGTHPIMNGVVSFNGGIDSFRGLGLSLQPSATLLANWATGEPLIAYKEPTNGRTVSLNFYPPSSDARFDLWDASTDGDLIMANALSWAAGHENNSATCTQTVTVLDNPTVSISSPEDAMDGILDDIVTIYFGAASLLDALGVTNMANLISALDADCPDAVSYQWQYQNLGSGTAPIAGEWVDTLGTSEDIVINASGVHDFHHAYRVVITNTADESAASNYIRVYSIDTRCKGDNKVKVCMVPNGNPDNAHEICININAVDAILENSPGSFLGPCDPVLKSSADLPADFEIFPNPTSSTLNIEYMPYVSSDVRIELYNSTGQLMMVVFNGHTEAESVYRSSVDMREFSDGMYLVRLIDSQGARTLRLVVTK